VTNSKARDKIRTLSVSKTLALSEIILKLFHVSILRSPEWALSSLPTELANSQTSEFRIFKKITGPFNGLVIWEERSSGRSPLAGQAHLKGRSLYWRPLIARPNVGRTILPGPPMGGAHQPLRFVRRGCCSIRVRVPNLTDTATITPMGWLSSNLHIVQIGRYLTHPLSVICYRCLLFTNGTLTHSNFAHLQLTCNQQDKTPEPTSPLSVLPLTHSTLVPNTCTIDWDTLTLNESRTEHIRKGHQRHGHPQLAIHATTRSQSTQKWIHNPHAPIEILSEILLKD